SSPYLEMLSEYDSKNPVQHISTGSLGESVVDTHPPSSKSITNQDVQKELARLIDAGDAPANDDDTLYMVHFPPGVSIDLDGSTSCEVFCGYHHTFKRNGKYVFYGVIPDQGGGCAGGCGEDPDAFNNLTSVASHEFAEAVTDPGVGLATGNSDPLGWYDQTN